MILNYNDFLIESLILESDVVYSNKFKTIVSRVKDNRLVDTILGIENKDIDITYNFFDIKDDNDNFLTFTPDRIANALLSNDKEIVKYQGGKGWLTNNIEANNDIFTHLGYSPVDKSPVYDPPLTEFGEVVSCIKSEKSGKTWCYVKFTNGEGVYNKEKLIDAKKDIKKSIFSKNRQEIRIGRAIRLLLNSSGIKYVDSEIEDFVNKFRSIISIINDVFSRFEIVDGDDLGFWYHKRNYLNPTAGTLGSSCQAVGRLDWLQIYIRNPETVKLVILRSDEDFDKIIGRALLWNLDDGSKMMDYIYTTKDSDSRVFQEYATKNGWSTYNQDKIFVAHLKDTSMQYFPSIDTMNKWNQESGKISNRSFPGSEYIEWTNNDGDGDDD